AMAPSVMPAIFPSARRPAYMPPWAPNPMMPRRTFFSDMVSPFCGGAALPGGDADGSGGTEERGEGGEEERALPLHRAYMRRQTRDRGRRCTGIRPSRSRSEERRRG